MNTPKFEENARPILEESILTFKERGDAYGDTWRNCQFLVMKAIARELGCKIEPDQFRALATAAFIDMKYQRFEGGYKKDNLIDGINYQAFLAGEMERPPKAPDAVVYHTNCIKCEAILESSYEKVSGFCKKCEDVPF